MSSRLRVIKTNVFKITQNESTDNLSKCFYVVICNLNYVKADKHNNKS